MKVVDIHPQPLDGEDGVPTLPSCDVLSTCCLTPFPALPESAQLQTELNCIFTGSHASYDSQLQLIKIKIKADIKNNLCNIKWSEVLEMAHRPLFSNRIQETQKM